MYEKYLKLLEERGVTTYQVCQATGISENTISMWKTRSKEFPEKNYKLRVDNLAKLAKYFEVPIEYFLEE